MDIFEKCYQRYIQDEVREQGVYPYFRALESRQDTEVIMEGKRRIMLGSNNYLGLTTNSSVIEAGVQAYRTLGSGCSGSRFLNGTLKLHLELEDELAKFLRKDAVVTFSTGFQSNLGIISSIVGLHDYVIMDRENHASLYDGCKLSYGKMLRYQHNDMADLEKKLQKVPDTAGCLIVTDGVFSMGGDIANLPEICALAQKYGARVMVDDAHGLGVIGEGAAARQAITAWRIRSISTWARSPSLLPRSAAIWRPAAAWQTSCVTARVRSSSPPPFRPQTRRRPLRPCASSRRIPSSSRRCRRTQSTCAAF